MFFIHVDTIDDIICDSVYETDAFPPLSLSYQLDVHICVNYYKRLGHHFGHYDFNLLWHSRFYVYDKKLSYIAYMDHYECLCDERLARHSENTYKILWRQLDEHIIKTNKENST